MIQSTELVLWFSRKYQIAQILLPGTVILVPVFLLVLSMFTDRPDLAVGYRWGAVVVAAIVVPWTISVACSARRPALRATSGGVHLRNGRVLEWHVFSEALLVNIEGEEWMGLRFRRGARESLDLETREIISSQDGWMMAKLACAFPTRSLTVERRKAIESVIAISQLQLKQHGGEVWYTRDPKATKREGHGRYFGILFMGFVVAGILSAVLGESKVIEDDLSGQIFAVCWLVAMNLWHLAVIFDRELPLIGGVFPSRQKKPIRFWISIIGSAIFFNVLGTLFVLNAFYAEL